MDCRYYYDRVRNVVVDGNVQERQDILFRLENDVDVRVGYALVKFLNEHPVEELCAMEAHGYSEKEA